MAFLQIAIVLIGIGVLVLMLWEPHLEGRNVNATLFQIYFNDPFLAYAYMASIAFFAALYHAFKLLGCIGQGKLFSLDSVRALRIIKYCAMIIIFFLVGAEGYINIVQRRVEEDVVGGVAIGLFLIFIFAIVAIIAAVFERKIKSIVEIKSKNDLTA